MNNQYVGYIDPSRTEHNAYTEQVLQQIEAENRTLVNGQIQEIDGSFLGSQVYYARKNVGVSVTKGTVVPRFKPGYNIPVKFDDTPALIVVPIGNNTYRVDVRPPAGKFIGYIDFSAGTTVDLPSGNSASVVLNKKPPHIYTFNFGIPTGRKGDTGDKGETGDKGSLGPKPVINAGFTKVNPPGTTSKVEVVKNGASTFTVNFSIEKGDSGETPSCSYTVTLDDNIDKFTIKMIDKDGTTEEYIELDHTNFDPTSVFNANVA